MSEALSKPPLLDFFSELEKIDRETLITKPASSWFDRGPINKWRKNREERITQLARKYVGLYSPDVQPSGDAPAVSGKILEEAKIQLVKETCMEEKRRKKEEEESKRIIREPFSRVLNAQKDLSYLWIRLVRVGPAGERFISAQYRILIRELKIFIDVPSGEPMLLVGKRGAYTEEWEYVYNGEIHIHSEEEADKLIKLLG